MTRASTSIAALFAIALTVLACAREPDAASAPTAPAPSAADESKAQDLRKVVRKATLSLEVSSAKAAHARAVAIAEELGGHVLASSREETRGAGNDSSSLSLRVPGDRLTVALTRLRSLATGATSERIATEDVTDEFVDTQSRLRNHRRLEEQLLELLKTSTDVEGALKVHRELGAVRGEIERLEGRRQFLERQTTWATVELVLSELPVAALSEGFLQTSIRRAKHDALAIGQGIVVAVIRLIGVFLPVVLLLALPAAGCIWLGRRLWLRRRAHA